VLYAVAVAAGARAFTLAVAAYLPAVHFLLAAFALRWARTHERAALLGVAAATATLAAALLQQARIAPPGMSHDTLYHLVQGAALVPLFVAARALASREPGG
jgi:hypothetical protein